MFVRGRRYRRSALHQQYGGQRQGGISTPKSYPIVLIFTGRSGERYGYQDGWTDEGVFEYTGEGQRGDMRMAKGNLAILQHADQGRDVHLFEAAGPAFVRYVGQMVCTGFATRVAPDAAGRSRKAIMFHLAPIEGTTSTEEPEQASDVGRLWTMPMAGLRRVAAGSAKPVARRREQQRTTFQRSQAVRVYVLRRADGVCEACGAPAPFTAVDGRLYLEPHHLRRLSDGGPDDPLWVAGVCPNCHRQAHHGKDRRTFNSTLAAKTREKETGLRAAESSTANS